MRVGFDAGPVFASYSGIGQYVRCLFPAMMHRSPDIEWTAYAPSNPFAQPAKLPQQSQISWTPSSSWLMRLTGNVRHPPHVFHGTNFKAPHYGQQRTVLTIHDLWLARHPQYSKKFFGQALASWKLRFRARHVSRVIAVSHFSAREIQEVLHLPAEHIAVIYHGGSPGMFPGRDEQAYQEVKTRLHLSDRPYILFVGGAEPRKNHAVLFEAFSRSARLLASCSLVAVGDARTRGASLLETAGTFGISHAVSCPGYVSTEDLRTLYAHAECFVFPSHYEGFGIPLLDAMACGAPIITAARSALPEVAGDAAICVDSQDPEQLGIALERLVHDRELQAQLRKKGFARVKQFSWERAAEQTLNLYREVLG